MESENRPDNSISYILEALKERDHERLPLRVTKDKQSYIIGHQRKHYFDGSEYLDEACKLVSAKKNNTWRLYWKRKDGKWHLYEKYSSLDEVLREVKEDPNGCFWG